ncbi:serpin family protein [Flintibacter porci]|uniref:serpin family protein n=1 Tax=Flintibacter porci TaxID=3342383 RepID=UPI003F8AD34D
MKRTVSILLASALLLSLASCGPKGESSDPKGSQSSSQGQAEPVFTTLKEPTYPEFPQFPQQPEDGPDADWDAYYNAYDEYYSAVMELRSGGIPEGTRFALSDFAAKSTPLALAGQEGKNSAYSPASLWAALAMLVPCAQGDSQAQLLSALGVAGQRELTDQVGRLWKGLYTNDGVSSLILSNSVWLNDAQEGEYVQATLDTLGRDYFAGVYTTPMGTAGADQAITDWISKETGGLIGGDGPVVETTPDTLLLLASSLYYKAAWVVPFDASQTQAGDFTTASGETASVDFMHTSQDCSFLRRENYQAAALETQLGEMFFVLPEEGTAPEELLSDTSFLSSLSSGAADVQYGTVEWSVPKFDLSADLDLMSTLKALGITDLLNPDQADLSGLTSMDTFLTQAEQMTRVSVDEEGVEAAAVTIIADCKGGAPDETCVMNLNRPFLFVLRSQGVTLFVGVVNEV